MQACDWDKSKKLELDIKSQSSELMMTIGNLVTFSNYWHYTTLPSFYYKILNKNFFLKKRLYTSEITYSAKLHSHGKGKTKFYEWCLFQRHARMFWILRYFHLKFHTPIAMLVLTGGNSFFQFCQIFVVLCVNVTFIFK